MSEPHHTPRVRVDLSALCQNAKTLRARAGCPIGAVVKANAYGLGAAPVVRALSTRAAVDVFFVAYAEEAAAILDAAAAPDHVRFYVLNGPAPGAAEMYTDRRIVPVINSLDQAATWERMGGGPCAIGIDIGMNRLGLTLAGTQALISVIPPSAIELVVMHLSHSGDADAAENASQISRFADLKSALAPHLPNAGFSISASGGVFLGHSSAEILARPGIALYGASPTGNSNDALTTVATLEAPVLMRREAYPGEAVGYNGTWQARRPTQLAILALGYADGYPRALGNTGTVIMNDRPCPVVGAVSMDLITVDITDIPGPVEPGQMAEIYGAQNPVDVEAAKAGTIGYELLSALGPRVVRQYTD